MKFESVEQAQALWQFLPPEQQVEAHDYVVQQKAKEGGASYDPVSGQWSDQDYGGGSKTSSTTTSGGKSRKDYQADAEGNAAAAIKAAFGDSGNFKGMSDDEIASYADNLSKVRYDAAIQALRGNSNLLKSQYEGAVGELDALYGGRKANAEALMVKAGEQARDEAIARGGQRGGLETYIENNLDKQIMGNLNQAENEIMAKKNTLRGGYDAAVTNNLAAIQQALSDKGNFQAATAFDTRAGQADKSAYYANLNNQLMAPYMMETANQKRGSDQAEWALSGYSPNGQDYGSVTSNNNVASAIAALQKKAGDTFSGLSAAEKSNPNVWTQNSALSGLHNQVAQLQGNNATFNTATGKWTTLDNLLNSYGI